ncbi:MAG: OmpA family protein [Deltaproteobacteria bacterium]|nr:OmpA family protein [Deltaproteobacteria bacterium]
MKKMGGFFAITMALAFAVGMALPSAATAKMVKKVDNLIVAVDQSGSMSENYADTGQKKIEMATDMISKFDGNVPELGYMSGLYLFSPFEEVTALETYQNNSLSSAAASVDTGIGLGGRYTKLGNDLQEIDSVLEGLSGKTALVIFTDGDSNMGADAVAEAQALYDKYGANLCIHAVSLADSNYGQKVIDEIRGLSDCSVSADGNSLASSAGMAQFAQNVLFDEVSTAAPAPAPAPVMKKEVITFNLLFGFDKADITDDMIPVLEQVQMILEEDPAAKFVVAGHTDSVGSELYNQGLSERRAGAVSNWLIGNGVPANRLQVVGYGETMPKFDNNAEEGRTLNRRVEIMTK